ncbi:MAG: alpha/beta fold hydrolase [Candidatus Zixiibacteriota bacterium]
MAFSEESFKLTTPSGEAMYGIAHLPERPNGAAVIMFNIGLHYRVCHSRLFVRQARDLQLAGFSVIRFDPCRVGYSHGEIRVQRAIDSYDSVQTGLFKDDARQVIEYARERFKPGKLFLYGLCGGALTATIAAALDKRIDGVAFVAGPVTVTSPEVELSTLHPFDASVEFRRYQSRLLNPSNWLRALTGRVSYRAFFNTVAVVIKDRLRRRRETPPDQSTSAPAEAEEQKGDLYNRTYHVAFDTLMKTGKQVLFLMPELDRATYDFDRFFSSRYLPNYEAYKHLYTVERVDKANHTFSTPASSRQLFDITREWLTARAAS